MALVTCVSTHRTALGSAYVSFHSTDRRTEVQEASLPGDHPTQDWPCLRSGMTLPSGRCGRPAGRGCELSAKIDTFSVLRALTSSFLYETIPVAERNLQDGPSWLPGGWSPPTPRNELYWSLNSAGVGVACQGHAACASRARAQVSVSPHTLCHRSAQKQKAGHPTWLHLCQPPRPRRGSQGPTLKPHEVSSEKALSWVHAAAIPGPTRGRGPRNAPNCPRV